MGERERRDAESADGDEQHGDQEASSSTSRRSLGVRAARQTRFTSGRPRNPRYVTEVTTAAVARRAAAPC